MNNELKDSDREELGQMLTLLLTDEYVLYATTWDYCWNVRGPADGALHEQLEGQYEQIARSLRDLANRARTLGTGVRGHWVDLTKAARSSPIPGLAFPIVHMLTELLALHDGMVAQLHLDRAACIQRFADFGTAGFLETLIKQHEQMAVFLRAQLGSRVEKVS